MINKYILGGAVVVALLLAGAVAFLFHAYSNSREELGKANAINEVVTDANKEKSDAVKERARTEHDVRQLPDPALIEWLR